MTTGELTKGGTSICKCEYVYIARCIGGICWDMREFVDFWEEKVGSVEGTE